MPYELADEDLRWATARAWYMARRIPAADVQDLISDACFGLFKASRSYNGDDRPGFLRWAVTIVRRAMISGVRDRFGKPARLWKTPKPTFESLEKLQAVANTSAPNKASQLDPIAKHFSVDPTDLLTLIDAKVDTQDLPKLQHGSIWMLDTQRATAERLGTHQRYVNRWRLEFRRLYEADLPLGDLGSGAARD